MPKYAEKERAKPYSQELEAWRAAAKDGNDAEMKRHALRHDRRFSPKNQVINGVKLGPIHDGE